MITLNKILIAAFLVLSMLFIFGCKATPQPVMISSDSEVKNTLEFETSIISLSKKELEEYQEYEKSGNEQLLKDLTPMEIFKYYFHAFKTEDYKTLYGLYIKGEVHGTPTWKQFSKDMGKKSIVQMVLLNKLQYNIKNFAQINYDDGTAYIQINFRNENNLTKNGTWNFKLIKNSQDIWKVNWLPLE